jgi:hypothetical protein
VLVGEDEVPALGSEVGLEDIGRGGVGGHATKVASRTSYFQLGMRCLSPMSGGRNEVTDT